ncbi:MAG: hypothetical protein J7500_06685 [Sphingomonas sp.]|nr:hypothetical protein [Sphingomonas sp.]
MLLGLGIVLMLAAPLLGVLPGPGGIFVFAGGLVLALRNSPWARKRFARLCKRYPKLGHYSDMALRRPSSRRRRARAQEAAVAASGNADRMR